MFILYIDPGTGSMLISAVIALCSVGFFMLKGIIYRKFSIGGDKGEILDPSYQYGIVFYSEGRQYWNVFKPLIEEAIRLEIPVTYLSSDKEDEGLQVHHECVETLFIGSGREAFYFLNRIRAHVVVLTTPGLDVLEIKRSKNVNHYVHISHSMSSMAGYKSYATDYFDSVILGGLGDVEMIRELEEKRKLPKKDIKVIGHTYVDVLREKLKKEQYEYTLFKEKKPTILISPTWGNHGLLTTSGDALLKSLDNNQDFNIIIRPHPQSYTSDAELIKTLMAKYPNNANRLWDRETENLKSMAHADIMISDFSGIIFDFFALFQKPILTMHAQYEKRGRDAMDLEEEPWDLVLLDKIGKTIQNEDIEHIIYIIKETISKYESNPTLTKKVLNFYDHCPNESGTLGMSFINEKYEEAKNTVGEMKTEVSHSGSLTEDYIFDNASNPDKEGYFKRFCKAISHPNMLFQYTVASALLVVFSYVTKRVVPHGGVNWNFFSFSMVRMVLVTVVLGVLFLLSVYIFGKGRFNYKKQFEKFEPLDLLMIALPMTPIIQYILANRDILSVMDSMKVFAYFAGIAILLIIVIPLLLSTVISKAMTMSVSMAFLYIFFNMASFGKTTAIPLIIALLYLIMVLVYIAQFVNKKKIVIVVSLVFFVATAGTSFFKKAEPNTADETTKETAQAISDDEHFQKVINNRSVKKTPDIFLMIYDSYSNQETMEQYGYDNSEQYEYLLDQGFAIYDGTYSVAAASLDSMSRVLQPLPFPADSVEFRRLVAGDATTLRELRDLGYYTSSMSDSDYLTKDFKTKYDFSFPDDHSSIPSHKIIKNAIIEGEFRFDIDFSEIDYDDYLAQRKRILSQNLGQPEFLYSHNNLPGHSTNAGVLRPNETELHISALQDANREMRQDLEDLQLENRDAIVIIAGDHGPYLTKNGIGLSDYDQSEITRLDVQDRFGTFLAIKWPDKSTATQYDIKKLQDVMPAIMAYMYDDMSIYEQTRMNDHIISQSTVGGIDVKDGIIIGGPNDGQQLFLRRGVRVR